MPLPEGFTLEKQPQISLPEGFKLEESEQGNLNLPAGFQLEKPEVKGESGFVPSIMRGGRGMASLATDVLPAMVGKALGKDEYAKQQMEEAGAYQKETERMYPAAVASYKDIHGVGDALTYVKESIGEAIPSLIPSLFTGGAAGFAVRGATTAAMQIAEQTAVREVAKAAAKNVLTQESLDGIRKTAIDAGVKEASRIALKAEAGGALAGSALQNIPDVYQNIYEATGQQDLGAALAFGSFNAALDAITPINLLRKASKAGIGPEEIAAAWYKRAGKGAAEGFVTEGGTEALQEVSSAAAEKFVDNNQQFFSEKNFERFVNAGLKGGAGGAGVTSATNVAFGKGPEKEMPVPRQEQAAPTPEAAPVEERVAARAQQLQSQGMQSDDAIKVATRNIADEDAKARAPEVEAAVANVTPAPELVAELTTMLQQEFKLTPAEAQETAIGLATEEAKEKAAAQIAEAGETNAGQPIPEAGGVSPELAGQPSQVEPTRGPAQPATDGMVPVGEDVAPAPAREEQPPVALIETEPSPNAFSNLTRMEYGEPISLVAKNEAGEEIGRLTYMPNGGPVDVFVREQDRREGVATALYDAHEAAGGKLPDVDSGVAISDEARAVRAARQIAKTPQEGTQVGAETTEAVQAEAQGQEPAPTPAAEIKPEKPVKLTKADRKSRDDANLREVEAVAEKFEEAVKPLSREEEDRLYSLRETNAVTGNTINPEDAYDPVRDHRQAKIKAIRDVLELRERMATASPEVKARINDMLYHPEISAKEVADVRTGMALQRKYSAQLKAAQAPANTAFNKATNGVQALAIITKTGNAFEKELAKRLRSAVQGVKFVIVEKGNEPAALKTEKSEKFWKDASGLFVQNDATGERTVYVAGASYGDLQGINNITVLHELLHAATNQKLYLGLKALERGWSSDANVTKATRDLQDVMHRVQDYIMENKGALPPAIREIIQNTNGMAITDLREFLAYGMSDPDFQKYMMQIQGVEQDVSFFSRFVTAIREFFKMGEDTTNALTDLIVSTDRLLSAKPDARMRFLEAGDKALAQRGEAELKMSQQKVSKSTQKHLDKLTKSSFADNLRDTIPAMTALRGETPLADLLSLHYKNFKLGALKQLLPTLQTETLVQMADRIDVGGGQRGIPGIAESWQTMGDMIAMRTKLTNAMGKINERLNKVAAKFPEQYKKLADVMHFSTLLSKDPATNKSNTALNRMWGELTPENQKLYEEMRDFYKNNHELYHTLLDEQLAASTLPQEAKSKLIASIKKMYEDGKKLYPYFPLMRYGQFWVRVGKGKDGEFHMFESAIDRDTFVLGRVKQLNESGDKRSREEMIKDLDLDEGNDLTSARRKDDSASDMLKKIFTTIDTSSKDGDTNSEALKDEIYQLYLQTLPDRNFRRQYLKRQGKAGFSGDIQRNFINTGTNTANQLARIKYGPTIMNQLERAENSLQGNPDKARLGEFVSEMRIRAEQQVRPDPESGALFAASKILNTSAFLWMMTSVKTMVAQFTSVPIFVAPVLASKHGVVKTAAALGKSLNVFNGLGIVDKDGNYTAPSTGNLKGLSADEKAAFQYMVDRGLSDNTMAYDLGNRRDISTAAYNNKARAMARQVSNAMTAMFHHAERLIREVTFMSSYRLNRDEGKTHEQALRLAEAESHEALNNYHASNRPRGIGATSEREVMLNAQKPIGRAILQFKMYPAFVTTYFVRNFYRMTRDMDPQVRKEARIQFIGSMMMSYSLAGYIGIPGVSFAMGILQGLLNGLRGEDDDDELEKRNLEFWFRNKWMPETFGNIKIGGKGLDELLDRGLISGLTGYDITSSLSMNNMWLPEQKEQATAVGEMQSFLLSLAGPGASLATTQIPKAVDYFNQGKVLQGMEQLSPGLFRGSVTAYRYGQEGATTASGAVIKEPNEFTKGQLLAQSAGFVTEGLQAKREAIFALQGEIMKVKQERTKLLDRLDREISQGSDEAVETAFDKVFKFNSRNPMDAIDNDNIKQSLKKQMERRLNSDRGFPIDKKYYPFVMDLLEPSTARLDREAAK